MRTSLTIEVARQAAGSVAGVGFETMTVLIRGYLDMQGFESVTFVALLGTLTATQATSLKAQQSDDDGAADAYSDLAGSDSGALADTDDDKGIVLTVVRPTKRYVRPVLLRGTANAVIDGIVAILEPPHSVPTTHDASVAKSETVVSPAEGTA